jgi:AcrR family transcriptional regulator
MDPLTMTDPTTPHDSPTSRSASKRGRAREEVGARVLAAWGHLLGEKGYGATTLADVAQKAGLVRSSVYRYFPDKESLLFAYVEERIAAFVDELRRDVLAADDAPGRMRRLIVGELRRFALSPEIVRADVPRQLSREGQARLLRCFEPLRDLTREIIEQGRADGSLPALDAEKALPLVFACIDVFRDSVAGQWLDPDTVADDIVEFVLRGLGRAAPMAVDRAAGSGDRAPLR